VIVPRNGSPGSNLHHFSLELAGPEALDAGAEGLARRGIAIERKLEIASKRSLFIRDPDGQRIEFYVATRRGRGNGGARAGARDPYAV
jgi:hypothetical protein